MKDWPRGFFDGLVAVIETPPPFHYSPGDFAVAVSEVCFKCGAAWPLPGHRVCASCHERLRCHVCRQATGDRGRPAIGYVTDVREVRRAVEVIEEHVGQPLPRLDPRRRAISVALLVDEGATQKAVSTATGLSAPAVSRLVRRGKRELATK